MVLVFEISPASIKRCVFLCSTTPMQLRLEPQGSMRKQFLEGLENVETHRKTECV